MSKRFRGRIIETTEVVNQANWPFLEFSSTALETYGDRAIINDHRRDPLAFGESEQFGNSVLLLGQVHVLVGYLALAIVHLGCR